MLAAFQVSCKWLAASRWDSEDKGYFINRRCCQETWKDPEKLYARKQACFLILNLKEHASKGFDVFLALSYWEQWAVSVWDRLKARRPHCSEIRESMKSILILGWAELQVPQSSFIARGERRTERRMSNSSSCGRPSDSSWRRDVCVRACVRAWARTRARAHEYWREVQRVRVCPPC